MMETYIKRLVEQTIAELESKPLEIKIKYLSDDAKRLVKIDKGDWIDVYAGEDVFIPANTRKLIPLGFCAELPAGYEAYLLPRSSTFKNWGIIVANSMGIIDESYKGDNDQWYLSAYSLNPDGTSIKKDDKIAQFRITKKMPQIIFTEVDSLGNKDRSGFGSTGTV